MEKVYLAAVQGVPEQKEWVCRLKLESDPQQRGRMKVDLRHGKVAETVFRVLRIRDQAALVEARPFTGRTHQIRVHLAESGHPVIGDELYGGQPVAKGKKLGLRAIRLAYPDPFTRRQVVIHAPFEEFVREYGFDPQLL